MSRSELLEKHVRCRADEQAKRVAQRIGGVPVTNSGAGIRKGDVDGDRKKAVDGFAPKIECKFTDKASLSIKLDWLRNLTLQALDAGRYPMVQIEFTTAAVPMKKEWVLLEYDEWCKLNEVYKAAHGII